MKKNVNQIDRSIRAVIGLLCAYLAFVNPLNFNSNILLIAIALFALINLFSALFSFCPLYKIAGISTRKE